MFKTALSRCARAAALFSLFTPLAAARPLVVEIDGTDLPRKLLHARVEIPVDARTAREGSLALWYPKWIPGTHGPTGPVQNLAGIVLRDQDGETLKWTREPGEVYRVNVSLPRGIRSVVAELRYVTNQPSTNSKGVDSYGSDLLGFVSPNTVLLVPDGLDAATARVRASLLLPDDWTAVSSLEEDDSGTQLGRDDDDEANRVAWKETTLERFVDSPAMAGLHVKVHDLVEEGAAGTLPPHRMAIFSEAESVVDPPDEVMALYRAMVTEAALLFGSHPYREYDVLLATTNVIGRNGLEHLESSFNVIPQRSLMSEKSLKGWDEYLVPHEFVHSWCGKYRRPAGMVTRDFHSPKDTELLWVYEGLTQHLGAMLAVRSGMTTLEEYRWSLQRSVRSARLRQGREWRPLSDTGASSHTLRGGSASWGHLRRSQDYYSEGALIWLEIDGVLRRLSDGGRTLEDFCRVFFAHDPEHPRVKGFTRAEVVATLGQLVKHDWDGFLRQRVEQPADRLQTRVAEELGLLVQYTNERPEGPGDSKYGELDLRESVGADFGKDGKVRSVQLGSPADAAGLGPGMKVLGIGDHVWNADRLVDTVANSVTTGSIDLLLVSGERLVRRAIDYDGGPRYLVLVRDEEKPDLLADILRPLRPGADTQRE
jgi:predicted metalloprotease with PDZ domain